MNYTIEDIINLVRKFVSSNLWGEIVISFQNGFITTIKESVTHKKDK